MSLVEMASRSLATALPLIGGKILAKHRLRQLIAEAQSSAVTGEPHHFMGRLDSEQTKNVKNFAASPQFSHLVLQALTCEIAGNSNDSERELREQVRQSLRHACEFDESELFEATDIFLEIIQAAVTRVKMAALPGSLDKSRDVVLAGRVAAAGARNSELLARVERLNQYAGFADELRSAVVSAHAGFRLAISVHNGLVNYSRLYVPPTLHAGSASGQASGIEEVLTTELRLVVLGDPGAGKSTLAAKLAYDIAMDRIDPLKGQVPILLIVRDHANLRTEHETLAKYLEATCRRPYNLQPPPDALEYLLLNGRATVIIDGVDELGADHIRVNFARLVEGFSHRFPLTRIIVTSRLVGYYQAALDPTLFTPWVVAPFSTDSIATYVRRWFDLDQSLSVDERLELTTAFMEESRAIADLRENPLVLSLLCTLYSSVHFIPSNRSAIYEKCAELLFETWDRSRGMTSPHRFASHIKPAVQRLAWLLFTDSNARYAISKGDLLDFLVDYMIAKRYEDPSRAAEAAEEFLNFCSGRAWVLAVVDSDPFQPHYGFVHKTFLEYFAASQLVKLHTDVGEIWAALEPRVGDAGWVVVGQIVVQLLYSGREGGADAIINMIVDRYESIVQQDPAKAVLFLLFAIRCTEDVAPDNRTLRRLVGCAVALSCWLPLNLRQHMSCSEQAHSVVDLADQSIEAMLAIRMPDNANRVREFVAEYLEQFAISFERNLSAAAVYDDIRHPGPMRYRVTFPFSPTMPPAVESWRRQIAYPTSSDIRDSLKPEAMLFASVRICMSDRDSVAASLLLKLFSPNCSSEEFAQLQIYLEEVSAVVFELASGWLALRPGGANAVVQSARVNVLYSLSTPARGAALMLLAPYLAVYSFTGDPILKLFVDARRETELRHEALEQIEQMQLPVKADMFIRAWIGS
ncbi:NACHT domain-containing protein [Micromonospora chokoriensis]